MRRRSLRSWKKAQGVPHLVALVLALVVIAIMIYIGYKYLKGGGESIGALGGCEGQGGHCVKVAGCEIGERQFKGLGCPDDEGKVGEGYCCMPTENL